MSSVSSVRAWNRIANSVHFFNIWTSRSAPNPQFLTLLTWKCASRHNGVHFLDIWTSKSGPNPSIFTIFDLVMCRAPIQRALFQHVNFQNWSEPFDFWHFWVGNVLRATTAHIFSTSELPKVVRNFFWLGSVLRPTTARNFSSLIWPDGSAPAALARLLLDHPEPQIIWKTRWRIATFLPFRAPASSFCSLFLSSALLTS